MTEPEDKALNIYQRMLKAQTELKSVSKNLEVGEGKSSYKAVSERDVLDAVKKVEEKCGIYSWCYKRELVSTNETTNKYGSTSFWQRFKNYHKFINVDKPEEYIETITFSDGVDTMDKGSGKGMTYGDKYALMKAYKISTGDDPDANESIEQETLKQPQKNTQKLSKTDLIKAHNELIISGLDHDIDFKEKHKELLLKVSQLSTINPSELNEEGLSILNTAMEKLINKKIEQEGVKQ